jgi:hypothetical protein
MERKMPAEQTGIKIKSKGRWLTIMQNAGKK